MKVCRHSVLGTLLQRKEKRISGAERPQQKEKRISGAELNEHIVFTDPAGLHHIHPKTDRYGPHKAIAASREIYKHINLKSFPDNGKSFPDVVQRAIQIESQAKYYTYEGRHHVIHVAAPNYRKMLDKKLTQKDFESDLANAYKNVFEEFARSHGPKQELRLLPISSGEFVKRTPLSKCENMAPITAKAVHMGFAKLSDVLQQKLQKAEIKMCIYDEDEFDSYESAFFCQKVKYTPRPRRIR